jgi:hypothetical protein
VEHVRHLAYAGVFACGKCRAERLALAEEYDRGVRISEEAVEAAEVASFQLRRPQTAGSSSSRGAHQRAVRLPVLEQSKSA